MKREIKFRAWHVSGQMIEWDSLLNHSMHFLFGYGTVTLMQYTGLRDKNGKEIYEGDIVGIDGTVGVVEFDETLMAYTANCKADDFYWDMGIDTRKLGIKVLGNIYEHPYLLKGGNTNASHS